MMAHPVIGLPVAPPALESASSRSRSLAAGARAHCHPRHTCGRLRACSLTCAAKTVVLLGKKDKHVVGCAEEALVTHARTLGRPAPAGRQVGQAGHVLGILYLLRLTASCAPQRSLHA